VTAALPPDPDPEPVVATVDAEAVASEYAVRMVQRTGEQHRFSEHFETKLQAIRAVREVDSEDVPLQFTRTGHKVFG